MVTLLVLIMATLENYFLAERNCWTQNVHLEVTFSKIRLAIFCNFVIFVICLPTEH